jgi:hypothetical protein
LGLGDTGFATVILELCGGATIAASGVAMNVARHLPDGVFGRNPLTRIDLAALCHR